MDLSANPDRCLRVQFERWNRRLHYLLGLYFLLFIWLFSLTGLLLNHPRWRLSRIPNDANPVYERMIEIPGGPSQTAQTQDIRRQLGLRGEIEWPASQRPNRLDFNVVYPRRAAQVSVDLATDRASVRIIDRALWPALTISHTFSGWRYNSPTTGRDWLLTTLWTLAMDALAIGLILIVCGSYYMWYRLKSKRTLGWIALACGFTACGVFAFGLAWSG